MLLLGPQRLCIRQKLWWWRLLPEWYIQRKWIRLDNICVPAFATTIFLLRFCFVRWNMMQLYNQHAGHNTTLYDCMLFEFLIEVRAKMYGLQYCFNRNNHMDVFIYTIQHFMPSMQCSSAYLGDESFVHCSNCIISGSISATTSVVVYVCRRGLLASNYYLTKPSFWALYNFGFNSIKALSLVKVGSLINECSTDRALPPCTSFLFHPNLTAPTEPDLRDRSNK